MAELGRCYWTAWGSFHPEWNYKNPEVRAMIFNAVAFWQARDPDALADAVDAKLANLPPEHIGGLFLGNHDVPRQNGGMAGKVAGRIADLLEQDPARLLQAAALLMSLPGTPFVFFGEEIGLPGGPGFDKSAYGIPYDPAEIWSKNPMQWDGSAGFGFTTGEPWVAFASAPDTHVAAQEPEQTSLLNAYRPPSNPEPKPPAEHPFS